MVFTAPVLCVVLVAVLVGAVLQRLSGTGMGLVLAPTLTLVLGAATGVLVANATTTMSGLMLMYAMRANIEWRRVGLLCASALPGAFVGMQPGEPCMNSSGRKIAKGSSPTMSRAHQIAWPSPSGSCWRT